MPAPDWYAAWREAAVADLRAQTAGLVERHRWDRWTRFDCDFATQTLTLSDGTDRLVADIQVVGSAGEGHWLWSWANESLDEGSVRDMHKVRAFGREHDIEDLTEPALFSEDPDALGWRMTAVSARILGAVGSCRAPTDFGAVYLICRSIGLVS